MQLETQIHNPKPCTMEERTKPLIKHHSRHCLAKLKGVWTRANREHHSKSDSSNPKPHQVNLHSPSLCMIRRPCVLRERVYPSQYRPPSLTIAIDKDKLGLEKKYHFRSALSMKNEWKQHMKIPILNESNHSPKFGAHFEHIIVHIYKFWHTILHVLRPYIWYLVTLLKYDFFFHKICEFFRQKWVLMVNDVDFDSI